MRKLLFIAALLLASMQASLLAQSSNLIYGSSRNPMMNSVNPAFFPSSTRMYIALPNANVDFTSPLAYSEIFTYDPVRDKSIINANQILDYFTDNRMLLNANVHAAGLGLTLGKIFLTASVQSKVNVTFGMPKGLSTLINDGNIKNLGPDNPLELLDGDLVSVLSYAEGTVGLGLKFGRGLTLGIRGKLLAGVADISNAGSSLKLTTAEDYSSIAADMNMNFHAASIAHFYYDSVKGEYGVDIPEKVNDAPQNLGYNFDIGFRYSNSLFEVSGSILDLGRGIHWEKGIQKFVSRNGNNHFEFSGVDVSNVMQGGKMDTNFVNDLIDSLTKMTEYDFVDDTNDYWTPIPTKINFGAMVHLTKGFSAGILFHGEFERGLEKVGEVFQTTNTGFHSNTSLLARINIADWVELVASTSVVTNADKWDWINPGFGVTLTPFRRVQAYAFLDYISDFRVVDAKRLNMSFGVNLMLGRIYESKSSKSRKIDVAIDY